MNSSDRNELIKLQETVGYVLEELKLIRDDLDEQTANLNGLNDVATKVFEYYQSLKKLEKEVYWKYKRES